MEGDEWERSESRTRIALDQSPERQCLASSARSDTAEAIQRLWLWLFAALKLAASSAAMQGRNTRVLCSFLPVNGLVVERES